MKSFFLFCIVFVLVQSSSVMSSDLTFANLTQGNYTEVEVDVSISSLSHLFDMSRDFVNIVFKPFSTIEEFLFDLIVESDNQDAFQELLSQWQTLLSFEVGYATCAVFGLIFVVLTIVVGLFMCCCRTCCDNCGGEMIQSSSRSKSKWRHCLCVSLLILSVFIAVPCVFVFLTNEWTTEVLEIIPDKTNMTFADITTYADIIPEQLNEIVGEYDKVDEVLRANVNDFGNIVGVPIRDTFTGWATPSLDLLHRLSNESEEALAALNTVNATTEALNDGVAAINQALAAEKEDLDNTLNNIACDNNPICRIVQESTSRLNSTEADFSSLDDVEGPINNLSLALTTYDIDEEISNIEEELYNIPQIITNGSQDGINQVLQTLNEVQEQLNNSLNSIPLQSVEEFKNTVEDVSASITNAIINYNDNFDTYRGFKTFDDFHIQKERYIAGVVLASMIAIIVAFYWFGIGIGTVAFDKHASDRSACSNCGGIFIMSAVGFTFIFAWLLMILVIISFTVGGHGERYLCQNFEPPYEGLKFTDEVLAAKGLGFSTINPDGNVTIYDLIMSCKNNSSIYEALKLEYLYNVTELVDNTTQRLDGFVDDLNDVPVDLNQIDVYPQQVEDGLQSITDSGIDEIDFDSYFEQIQAGLTATDLIQYAQFLNESADNMTDSTSSAALNETAEAIRNHSNNILQIQVLQVDPLTQTLESLNSSVLLLQNISAGLDDTVNATANSLVLLNDTIHTEGPEVVSNQITEFSDDLVGDVNAYTAWLLIQVTEYFGACRPVFLVYTQAVSFLCDYFMDILNGLWFSLGWCVFFLIPAAIVGMKLAKFYRRMRNCSETDAHWDNMEMDAFNRSHNSANGTSSGKFRSAKVHPGEYY